MKYWKSYLSIAVIIFVVWFVVSSKQNIAGLFQWFVNFPFFVIGFVCTILAIHAYIAKKDIERSLWFQAGALVMAIHMQIFDYFKELFIFIKIMMRGA